MKFILAKKVNMTQVFTEDGKVIPVTVLAAAGNKISAVKTKDKDHYQAVQVAMGKRKREFRITNQELSMQAGTEIKISDFEPGEVIDIKGVSKGRGFAGAMKRHGFHGAPASHGHDHPRAVGSIGQRFPQHTRKGLRMAGRMGGGNATVKHSMIVAVDVERNLIFVKGGVPGAPNSLVQIETTGAKKPFGNIVNYSPKIEIPVESPAQPEEAKPEVTEARTENAPS